MPPARSRHSASGGRCPAGGGLPELQRRLNAALPPDLAVRSLGSRATRLRSTARRARRVYRYRIRTERGLRPLERHRTLEIDDRLDVGAMQAAAARMRRGARLRGPRQPCARQDGPAPLRGATSRRRGDLVEVRVTANAFLRRMVRSLVAVLLEVGRGRLDARGGGRAPRRPAVGRSTGGRHPPRGLTLERVVYRRSARPRNDNAAMPQRTSPRPARGRTGEQGT